MKILFVVPYPSGSAPSQRFRFEQYLPLLQNEGINYLVEPFWSDDAWNILYEKGHLSKKAIYLLAGFLRRFMLLFSVRKYAYIFLHREATPIGPPWFEWICSRVFHKKIIYDFDDAIWLKNTSSANQIISWIKNHEKVASICKWSNKVSCGNDFLASYARQFNHQVIVNPTTIDTDYHIPNLQKKSELTVGWTGTHSTAKYLNLIVPVIEKLVKNHRFIFLVISDRIPEIQCPKMQFLQWDKSKEISQLSQFDIGIMPLENSLWEQGKCGFKILQYMAMSVAAVASPAGVNTSIIENGKNGFLCQNCEDWYNKLDLLLTNEGLRRQLGKNGRKTVIDHYSVSSNRANFFSLFA